MTITDQPSLLVHHVVAVTEQVDDLVEAWIDDGLLDGDQVRIEAAQTGGP